MTRRIAVPLPKAIGSASSTAQFHAMAECITPTPMTSASGLKGFFNCPTYSDLTIRCQARDFYAHRLVLASQSRHFNNMLDGIPATPIVNLEEENPQVIEAMLRFLYSADYRDCSSEGSVDAIAFNLEMLAQAGKYGIDALGQLAMEKLSAAAEEHWDTPSFVDVVSLAYRRVDILDDTVREVLVRVATDHAPELLSKSAFVGLMGNVQRFRNDFLEAALRREQETKRELPCMYCDLAERDCMCAAIWSG